LQIFFHSREIENALRESQAILRELYDALLLIINIITLTYYNQKKQVVVGYMHELQKSLQRDDLSTTI